LFFETQYLSECFSLGHLTVFIFLSFFVFPSEMHGKGIIVSIPKHIQLRYSKQ
jgi:hypothetical protein